MGGGCPESALLPNATLEVLVDADLDTLATALYVRTDDLLKAHPEHAPLRPPVGLAPRISDAELVTLAVLQALGGFTSEARWLRHANQHLRHLFPYQPHQPGYNKRLRALVDTMAWLIGVLAADTTVAGDDLWVVDSTPVECARSRETVRRSALAGWAQYGYCASHSRYFWGLRLHLVATVHGLPVGWAVTGAKADERTVLVEILTGTPGLHRPSSGRQVVIGDKNYYGRAFDTELAQAGITVLRPPRAGELPRDGARFLKPLRQVIESVNNTLKAQLDLERHGGRTVAGVCTRIAQRLLALTTAIWHNDHLGLAIRRSLIAYDH